MPLRYGQFAAGAASVEFPCTSAALAPWMNSDATIERASYAIVELAPVTREDENHLAGQGINQPHYPGVVTRRRVDWGTSATIAVTPGTWHMTVRLYLQDDEKPLNVKANARDLMVNTDSIRSGTFIVEDGTTATVADFLRPKTGSGAGSGSLPPVYNVLASEVAYAAEIAGAGVTTLTNYHTVTATVGLDYIEYPTHIEILRDV